MSNHRTIKGFIIMGWLTLFLAGCGNGGDNPKPTESQKEALASQDVHVKPEAIPFDSGFSKYDYFNDGLAQYYLENKELFTPYVEAVIDEYEKAGNTYTKKMYYLLDEMGLAGMGNEITWASGGVEKFYTDEDKPFYKVVISQTISTYVIELVFMVAQNESNQDEVTSMLAGLNYEPYRLDEGCYLITRMFFGDTAYFEHIQSVSDHILEVSEYANQIVILLELKGDLTDEQLQLLASTQTLLQAYTDGLSFKLYEENGMKGLSIMGERDNDGFYQQFFYLIEGEISGELRLKQLQLQLGENWYYGIF